MNWLERIITKELGITQYRFAKRCNVYKSTINRIINEDRNIEHVHAKTIEKFATGLGMTVPEFYAKYYKEG